MTSLPMEANAQTVTPTKGSPGDAVVVRSLAAALVLLALAAILLLERPAAYGVAATILVGAVGLFAAARWRSSA